MRPDPILEEVWRSKDEIAREFDYDIEKPGRDLMERQGKDGQGVVSFPAKRIDDDASQRKAS